MPPLLEKWGGGVGAGRGAIAPPPPAPTPLRMEKQFCGEVYIQSLLLTLRSAIYQKSSWIELEGLAQTLFSKMSTGVGSMGAPGAGAPMKFLSGTHTKSHFVLNCFLVIDLVYMHIGIRAPVYQIIFLRL